MQSLYRAFWLVSLLVLTARAQASVIGLLNAASLLDGAPLACRVQVLAVRSLPVSTPQATINTGSDLQDGVATVAVSRVLKGSCPRS